MSGRLEGLGLTVEHPLLGLFNFEFLLNFGEGCLVVRCGGKIGDYKLKLGTILHGLLLFHD